MLRKTSAQVRLAYQLWRQGVFEALQLQRCVVLFVLDSTGRALAQTVKCCIANGVIYLGSIALYQYAVTPAVTWLLQSYAEPAYGAAAVASWQQFLGLVFQLLWLMPVYAISILVSCIWYQQIAVAAYAVQQQQAAAETHSSNPVQQQQQEQQQAHPAHAVTPHHFAATQQAAPPPAGATSSTAISSSSSTMLSVLESTAQELLRVLLFLVFTVEVFLISFIPYAGPVLNVIFLSWLYAYYCHDYKWSLQGKRLPVRLALFEGHWAFFAGFGFPCVVATVFFPFHIGAALANLLFPVFILVACGSDPGETERSMPGPGLGRLPIFILSLWPTYWVIRRLFKANSLGRGAGSAAL